MQTENKTPQKHFTLVKKNQYYWIKEKRELIDENKINSLKKLNYTFTIITKEKDEELEKQKRNN